jgi:hypothetical protein
MLKARENRLNSMSLPSTEGKCLLYSECKQNTYLLETFGNFKGMVAALGRGLSMLRGKKLRLNVLSDYKSLLIQRLVLTILEEVLEVKVENASAIPIACVQKQTFLPRQREGSTFFKACILTRRVCFL